MVNYVALVQLLIKNIEIFLKKTIALARRFQKIDVTEPTVDETFEILKGLKHRFEVSSWSVNYSMRL